MATGGDCVQNDHRETTVRSPPQGTTEDDTRASGKADRIREALGGVILCSAFSGHTHMHTCSILIPILQRIEFYRFLKYQTAFSVLPREGIERPSPYHPFVHGRLQ